MKRTMRTVLAFCMAVVMCLMAPLTTLAEGENLPTTEAPVTETPVPEAPVPEAPVTEAPVTEAPATEAPVTEAPVTEAPVTEAPATEAPVTEAPVTEAPATEAPVTEAPVTEAPVTEAPATEVPVTEEPAAVDYTKAASESVSFVKGYAKTLRATAVYDSAAMSNKLGTLAEGGVVEVIDRKNAGASGDCLVVRFATEEGTVKGYVAAKHVRPMADAEVSAYLANAKAPSYEPASVADEEPTEEPAEEPTEEPTEEPAEESTEEPVVSTLVAGEVEMLEVQQIGEVMPLAYPGSVKLTANTTSTIALQGGAGASTSATADFTMTAAGLLTLSFASVGNAAGNLTIRVESENDNSRTLWTGTLLPNNVTTFSHFVEAGAYNVVISKSDSSDVSAYTLNATPYVSKTGEPGVRNNTYAAAAALTLNAAEITGIYSWQDVNNGNSDYYTFTLSAPSRVVLSASNMTNAPATFSIVSGNATLPNMTINAGACASENVSTTYRRTGWFDAGTYYVVMKGGSAEGRYTIKVDQTAVTIGEKEPNGTPSAAYGSGNTLNLTSGAYVRGMMGEADTVDYFYFSLPTAQVVDFAALIQFDSVGLDVFYADGTMVSGSSFGASGVGGSEDAPYTLTLNNLRLPAGNYYLRVSRSGNATGLYDLRATSKLTASSVTATVSGSTITMQGTYGGGTTTPNLHRFNVFKRNETTNQDQLIYTWESKTTPKTTLTVNSSGTYLIQYVVSDGTIYSDVWTTVQMNVQELRIISVSAVPDANGNIACTATYTGPSPITAMVYTLYRGTTAIDSYRGTNETKHTFKAPASGTYMVQFAATIDGITWTDGWGGNIQVEMGAPILPLSINAITCSADNTGVITCSTSTKNGYALIAGGSWKLYQNDVLLQSVNTTQLVHNFKVTQGGTYSIQFVGYDGVTWADNWAVVTVNLGTQYPLSVAAVNASSGADGVISFSATTRNGGALKTSMYHIYDKDNVRQVTVNAGVTGGTWTPVYDGTYLIQYVAYDGVTWADGWATVSVTLPPDKQPLRIPSFTVTGSDSGAINCKLTTSGGRGLQIVKYYLYSNDVMIDFHNSVSDMQTTFYVNNPGRYSVQAVAFDGVTWVDAWQVVDVNYQPVQPTMLKVEEVTVTVDGRNVACTATTNDSRPLTNAMFHLYRNNVRIATVNSATKSAVFTNSITGMGSYTVQFVAFDGTTWADGWAGFTVGDASLSVDKVTAVMKADGTLVCNAEITNAYPVQQAMFHVYKNNETIASWTWNGGSALTHTFSLSQGADLVQYVVYDGYQWKDGWANVVSE